MTNTELAAACKAAGQCRFCKPNIKAECLGNKCWKEPVVKDRACPYVYYKDRK